MNMGPIIARALTRDVNVRALMLEGKTKDPQSG